MRCLVAAASLLAVLGTVSVARADHHYKKWMPSYLGDWTYEWKEVDGDFSVKGTNSWTLQA